MHDDFVARVASFYATIAYGLLALAGLIVSALWVGDRLALALALLATGLSYVSQSTVTCFEEGDDERLSEFLRWAAVITATLSGLLSVFGA